jgi:hypothetical protein
MSVRVRRSPSVTVAEVEVVSELRLAVTGVIDDALQRAASPELRRSAPFLDLRRDLLDAFDLEEMLGRPGESS